MSDFATHMYRGLQPLPYNISEAALESLERGRPSAPVMPATSSSSPAAHPDQAEVRRQLIDAGRQFEAYFISYLLKVMRETVPQGMTANKHGAYFHSFYDQEIGARAAEAGGIGISRMVQEYAENNIGLSSVRPSSSGR